MSYSDSYKTSWKTKQTGWKILLKTYFKPFTLSLALLPFFFTLFLCMCYLFIWCIWWWKLESKYCVLCWKYILRLSVQLSSKLIGFCWSASFHNLKKGETAGKESEMRWAANQLNKRERIHLGIFVVYGSFQPFIDNFFLLSSSLSHKSNSM